MTVDYTFSAVKTKAQYGISRYSHDAHYTPFVFDRDPMFYSPRRRHGLTKKNKRKKDYSH